MTQEQINESFLQHLKTFQAKLEAAERHIISLEARLKLAEDAMNAYATTLTGAAADDPLVLARRRMAMDTRARTIRDDPRRIALALHLQLVRGCANQVIYHNGILSQSKVQGLDTWTPVYAHDYCLVHGVLDVLKEGIYDDSLGNYTDSAEKLLDYLQTKCGNVWQEIVIPENPVHNN